MTKRRKNKKSDSPNSPLGFGKYKNLTIFEISKQDISYLSWIIENNDWFQKKFPAKYKTALNCLKQYNSPENKAKRLEYYTKKSGLEDILKAEIEEYEKDRVE